MKTCFLQFCLLFVLAFCLYAPTGCSASAEKNFFYFSKPYMGSYKCTYLKIGEEDMLLRFSDLQLQLQEKGVYQIVWKEKKGTSGSREGEYSFDTEKNQITFSDVIMGKKVEKTFPVEKGVIQIDAIYGTYAFTAKFEHE